MWPCLFKLQQFALSPHLVLTFTCCILPYTIYILLSLSRTPLCSLSSSGVNTSSGSCPKSHSSQYSDLSVTHTLLSVDQSPDSGIVTTPVSATFSGSHLNFLSCLPFCTYPQPLFSNCFSHLVHSSTYALLISDLLVSHPSSSTFNLPIPHERLVDV